MALVLAPRVMPTSYNGVLFRSRTEARWAVFFDALKLRWQHEPEHYAEFGGAVSYLPDFWLPDVGWFFEVKPEHGGYDDDKVALAVRVHGRPLLVWQGPPAVPWGAADPACQTCPESGTNYPDAFIPAGYDTHFCNSWDTKPGVTPPRFAPDPSQHGCHEFWCDTPFFWTQCPECSELGITFAGDSSRLPCGCQSGDHRQAHSPALHAAITASRAHSFYGPAGK